MRSFRAIRLLPSWPDPTRNSSALNYTRRSTLLSPPPPPTRSPLRRLRPAHRRAPIRFIPSAHIQCVHKGRKTFGNYYYGFQHVIRVVGKRILTRTTRPEIRNKRTLPTPLPEFRYTFFFLCWKQQTAFFFVRTYFLDHKKKLNFRFFFNSRKNFYLKKLFFCDTRFLKLK